ncbi:hypothetical protein EVAR_56052_1 [Eumeta japonica]|uniref:Uncharacterized protein n=1 Tax=Eumeta variegata TaxID=151549 RepID=A0A4C1YC36_EUMVA|nr:hypothetical protein EVAR_56052_1 [Eumeta japonica]
MSMYPLTTLLDLRLSREIFKFEPLKWGHHHWTVGVVSPTSRRPGIRQHKSSVPHLHPQEKGCGRSTNEHAGILSNWPCGLFAYIGRRRVNRLCPYCACVALCRGLPGI